MNGTIKINTTKLAGYGRIAVGPYEEDTGNLKIGQTDSDASDCTVGMESIPHPTLVLNKCNLTLPVYVYLMNDNQTRIIGGKNFHEYILACTIPDDGLTVTKVAAAQLDIRNILNATTEYISVSLLMLITPAESVSIGDKLNISITIKQPASQDLYVLPTHCIAKSSVAGNNDLTLMTNGHTSDSNVLGEFNVSTKWIASADMYAFRFLDAATVLIECDVTVKNQTCVTGAYESTTPNPSTGGSRRRRSAQEDISGETFEVSASFQIGDKETDTQDSGQCKVRWNPTVVISLLLLTVTAFI